MNQNKKNSTIFNVELSNKSGQDINQVFFDILSKIFFFNKTFYSFKSSNGILYYRDSDDKHLLWKEAIYNKETQTVDDGKKVRMNIQEIFTQHLKDIVLDNNIELSYLELSHKYKEVLFKYYKSNQVAIINVLFYKNIEKKDSLVINKQGLSKEDIAFFNELNNISSSDEFNKFLKGFLNKKFNEKVFEKFLSDIYSKKDSKLLSKINSFFDSRVTLPGKYLIKHNELILEQLLMFEAKK
jgi:hypothetical protein